MRHTARCLHLLLVVSFAVGLAAPGLCWGREGHQQITTAAIAILPADLKPFYSRNGAYMAVFSALPDDWKTLHGVEKPNHYVNFEKLQNPPTMSLAITWQDAEKKFGKAKVRDAGCLPWVIAGHYPRLVKAFRDRNWEIAAVESAVLAHYIADAHQPLHATVYYDGRPAGAKKGIHGRWEIELLEKHPIELTPGAPETVSKVLKSAFEWSISSWKQATAILSADEKAEKVDPGHGAKYYQSLNDDTRHILKGRMTNAARAIAGVFVAAWRDAGKPKLPRATADYYWDSVGRAGQ